MTPSHHLSCLRLLVLCSIQIGQSLLPGSPAFAIPREPSSSDFNSTGRELRPIEPVPLQNRTGALGAMARGGSYPQTLSGTLFRQSTVTTSWFLYPGACVDRALGTWSPRSTPVADSLQPTNGFPSSSGYTTGQPNPASNTIAYTRADLSAAEKLWHVVVTSTPASERPEIIDGSRSLWCGKFDANWLTPVGYPNLTFQILYLDTGTHAADYSFSFEGNISTELSYDFLHLIGGGGEGQSDHADPLENRRDVMAAIVADGTGGPHGDSALLKSITGSITLTQTEAADGGTIEGDGFGQPTTVSFSITGIPAAHRAIYLVFISDCLFSSEDGLWPEGHGQILDLVETSDHGSIYDDQVSFADSNNPGISGIQDEDAFSGTVLVWSGEVIAQPGDDVPVPLVSARVASGVGELWQLASGSENATSDVCTPGKASATDLFFEGGEPTTNLAIHGQYNAIVSCAFPVPAGTGSVFVRWDEYVDLPLAAGYVQLTEYRVHRGAWSNWKNIRVGLAVVGAIQSWLTDGEEIGEAAQADSIQVRWVLRCIPVFAADHQNCASSQTNALLYDNLSLQIVSGVPVPILGSVACAQSTFIDGTIKGLNCQTTPCWPGPRGSDLPTGVTDNWNGATSNGEVPIIISSGLREGGMGVNWKRGFDLSIGGGKTISRSNGAYNPAHDVPRMIFRLFDPATRSWGPFDSTEMIAAAVSIADVDGAGPAPPDTTLINSDFQIDWPPYDKLEANAVLPGGFTINGASSYAALAFLPRGTRMQYYFKGVDINGGVTYRFSPDPVANETEELPILPGGTARAPDIIEFRVLPGVYPPGPAGSLLAGRTNTPVLNLDSAYTGWSDYDPVTQALRGLGVRADRYRLTGSPIGGHRLPGPQPDPIARFYPNYLEYPLVDSLAGWYRIIIESGHTYTEPGLLREQDAVVLEEWWRRDTGPNLGDRCFFINGDNYLGNLATPIPGVEFTRRVSLAQNVFGVSSASDSWSGTSGTPYPTIDDRFASPAAGPALAPASSFSYPLDGDCLFRNKFDALNKVADADAASVAFYPNGQTTGIARSREIDNIADSDRSKGLGYGFSLQFVRDPNYGPPNANYRRSGVENRMRVLYKFLTSCRAGHIGPSCWPCPNPTPLTIASMQSDWNAQAAGFQISTYGPLYPIQSGALATGFDESAPRAPHVNSLEQNRPNPFNPETVIFYSVAEPGRVVIRVFDISGRLVRTLVNGPKAEGAHHVRWDGKTDGGSPAASGLYFYRITYPSGMSSSRKLTLLR